MVRDESLMRFCQEELRLLMVLQEDQTALYRRLEAEEQKIRARLGIHPSVRMRKMEFGRRLFTLINRLEAILNGSDNRVDGK